MSYARLDEMMSHVHDFTPQESHDIPCHNGYSNGVNGVNGIKHEMGAITYAEISRSYHFVNQQHHAMVGMGMLNARCVI